MPLKYPWTIENVLDAMKSYRAYATKWTRCTICASNKDNHTMRYRIIKYNSSTCSTICEWFFKFETCSAENLATLYLHGTHDDPASSPRRKKLRLADKRFISERREQHVRPARIQIELALKNPSKTAAELPVLTQIQRFSYYYKRTRMLEDALVETMNRLIGMSSGSEEMPSRSADPFAIGVSVNAEGQPCVGNGSDDQPMQVGVTTTAMLDRLTSAADLTLHVDAKFKLNQPGFLVIVFGVSDMVWSFHPVAIFITSRLTAAMYERAINSLFDVYERHVGHLPTISRIMSDAGDALYNAVSQVAVHRGMPRPEHLMCFFHVMMNVKKHTRRLTKAERRIVKDAIYNMHFAATKRSTRQFASPLHSDGAPASR